MFFLLDTGQRLGFDQVFQDIKPRSPQGKKYKKHLQPFLPGGEKEFDQLIIRQKFWLWLAENSNLYHEMSPFLDRLQNIDGILERLDQGMDLDEGEIFSIKMNLAIGREICRILATYGWAIEELIGQEKEIPVELELYQGEILQQKPQAKFQGSGQQSDEIALDRYLHNARKKEGAQFLKYWRKEMQKKSSPSLGEMISEPIFLLDPIDELWQLLNPTGIETDRFYLRDEYDPELAKVRYKRDRKLEKMRRLRREALEELEKRLNRTIPYSGEIMVNKQDSQLLEELDQRGDLRLERETFGANYYRWLPGLKYQNYQKEEEDLEAREAAITARVLSELTQKMAKYYESLRINQQALAELDWMLAKVKHAIDYQCRPAQRTDEQEIKILQGRHLLVEAEVCDRGSPYTPIDIHLKRGVTVITGSNMGGKTLTLRMVGLLTTMAQYGLCVPAKSMELNLRDFVYFSVEDDQTKGDLSTFGQEIVGLQRALDQKDQPGLILIDELGRGTNPKEAAALGRGMISYLIKAQTITLITTHFTGLTQMQGIKHLQVVGLNEKKYSKHTTDKNSLEMLNQMMDYRLLEVGAGTELARDALRIASLLGLEPEIIRRAEQELKKQNQ